jgi:hypothetical protein
VKHTVLRRLLLLAALGCGGPGWAQSLETHLIPVEADLAMFGTMQPYEQAVRERLLGRARGSSAIVFPSFEKEWAVQLAHDRGAPFVLYAVMDQSLWGSLQLRVEREHLSEPEVLRSLRVPVTRHTAPLGERVASAVEAAWEAMLLKARQPVEPRRIIDGTSYLFFAGDSLGRQHVGLARSPQEGTPVAALADLAKSLRGHATATLAERQATEAAILSRAETVLGRAQAIR